MPKTTRTTVAVAIAFGVVATYGACVTALATSMYNELVGMPLATTVGVVTILLAALGLAHLVWMRGAMSPTICLVLLFLEIVCTSVLLGMAAHGVAKTTKAIETAPALTMYQHRMEAFLASDKARDDARFAPYNPTDATSTMQGYPLDAARAFSEAYCASEGRRFCSAFPFVQTIVFPGIWTNPNVTAAIARNLSTLPATLANVDVTATTTLDRFCAPVNVTLENLQWDMNTTDARTFLARLNDPSRAFKQDVHDLCRDCAALSNATFKHDALQAWIHNTCPMDGPKPSGVACLKAVDDLKRNGNTPPRSSVTDFAFAQTYRNPSFDACFGHTLMSIAQKYDRAAAITSGVLLCFLLVLAVRVWIVRRVQKNRDAQREAVVQTPIDNV